MEVTKPEVSHVLAGLQEQGVLFDFAVAQRDALAKPENAADFKLTDGGMDQFVRHVFRCRPLRLRKPPSLPVKNHSRSRVVGQRQRQGA